MKFAILSEHRSFFQKQRAIEFENILTASQIEEGNRAIDDVFSCRLKVPKEQLHQMSSEQLFMVGRDVWRMHLALKKIVCHQRFADTASELIESKPLRLAYDQVLVGKTSFLQRLKANEASALFSTNASLEQTSCFKGLLCGLMLCLSAPELDSQEMQAQESISVFPKTVGSAVFFAPDFAVDYSQLIKRPSSRFLLIVYTQPNTIYQMIEDDPHAHYLKTLGYVFGDKLSEKTHPLVNPNF